MIQAAGVLHQRLDLVLAPIVGRALEGPEADMAVRQPHHDGGARRRRLVVPLKVFARLDQGQDAAGRNAKALQHGRRQRLAHPALQRQPPVRMARPRRLTRAFGAQVEKATWKSAIARDAVARCLRGVAVPIALLAEQGCLRGFPHLRRQKAAPVADFGIVHAELVAVVAHGHGAGLAGQGIETAEMGEPFGVAQRLQPHRRRRPVVAQAQDRLREVGRLHGVAVVGAQFKKAGFGAIGGGDGHGPQMPLRRAFRNRGADPARRG